jgi:hypothetical protein
MAEELVQAAGYEPADDYVLSELKLSEARCKGLRRCGPIRPQALVASFPCGDDLKN